MIEYGKGWHTRGQGGSRGVQGGVRGHQGVLGATRLLPTPKWVIKQQNNGSKSWLKVPKVCPWPKMDGIYSFMMHLGPFGCITTALYSENANLWIPAISGYFTLAASTDQTMQFLDGFLIFLSLPYVGKLRKIKKPSKNCIVWSVEAAKVKGTFFGIFG